MILSDLEKDVLQYINNDSLKYVRVRDISFHFDINQYDVEKIINKLFQLKFLEEISMNKLGQNHESKSLVKIVSITGKEYLKNNP